MTCDELALLLTDFLEGHLGPEDEQAAIEHVSTCTACEGVLRETRLVITLSGQHGGKDLDSEARTRMFESITAELGEGR